LRIRKTLTKGLSLWPLIKELIFLATIEELAAISLFTDTVLLDSEYLKYLYSLAEKLEGRPVYTHELPKIADKHREELKSIVMDIYENAKDSHKESVNIDER